MLARAGRERTIVNRDNHYSPHFQAGTLPPCRACLTLSPNSHRNTPVPGYLSWARPSPWGFHLSEGLVVDSGGWPMAGSGGPSSPVITSVLKPTSWSNPSWRKPNLASLGFSQGAGANCYPQRAGEEAELDL